MNNAELIKALRFEVDCGDCAYFRGHSCDIWGMMCDAADALEAQQTALDECARQLAEMAARIAKLEAQLPKEGEWIDIDGTMFAECSVCGKRHYGCTTPYCDMCGARMRTVTDCHTLNEKEKGEQE